MNNLEKVQRLAQEILKHKALYYQGRAIISDHEFDRLEDDLKKIDPENPVLNLVGTVVKGSDKIRHSRKMLSLEKTYDVSDLKKWIGEHDVVSTLKVDGISCSLVYENGKLKIAKTRGDGQFGEDIFLKVQWIDDIVKQFNHKSIKNCEVRGEIYCTEDKLFHLSEEMEKIHLDKPSSQRNIVAGLIGRKENLELCRYLNFMAFDLLTDDIKIEFEIDKAKILKAMHFNVANFLIHTKGENIENAINDAKEFMDEGDYLIDGLVLTYNQINLHNELGETAHHPRYKIAFKFQGVSKKSTINEILWSVSRNGILTPIALVEPVELSGAMISRVTLHNYGLVKQYNLKQGDEIEIIRSGEVIPKFLSVIKHSNKKFIIPDVCPSCDHPTKIEDIRLLCTNLYCSGKVLEEILNFIQKIGIEEISSKRLEEMIKKGLIKNIADLYKLSEADFLTLDKVKEKLAAKFYSEIQKSKNVDLVTFCAALGLSGGAKTKCEKIVRSGFNTIDKIKNLTVEELQTVESFAEKSSFEFVKSIKEKSELIDSLLAVGFNIEIKDTSLSNKLQGLKICITGELTEKRNVVEERIRNHGGILVSSVSKNTDYLLTNEIASSSSKFKKAQELKIKIINENDFNNLIT